METTTITSFNIVGIAVRTSNQNGQSAVDIPQLWDRLLSENIKAQIPGRVNNTVYALYTDYEGDYTQPYTTVLGYRVEQVINTPPEFTAKTIDAGPYLSFTASGKLEDGIVFAQWQKIWNTDLPRAYTADFEIYNERAFHSNNAEVKILIAVN
jgi:predicted transcriptional regulator YdeE